MEKLENDILLVDGKYRRLTDRCKVRVDLQALSRTELEHLRSGIDAVIELRRRESIESRCWHVPANAVEVFVAK